MAKLALLIFLSLLLRIHSSAIGVQTIADFDATGVQTTGDFDAVDVQTGNFDAVDVQTTDDFDVIDVQTADFDAIDVQTGNFDAVDVQTTDDFDAVLMWGHSPTPLYRYWNPSNRDHFYTSRIQEIGTAVPGKTGKHGYKSEGIAALIQAEHAYYTVPLYRYWRGAVGDHFYTTNRNEIGTTTPGAVGNHGYQSEGIAGYCFPKLHKNTVPLYRYWNGAASDHFYTTNSAEIGTTTPGHVGNHGYKSEGIACYVYPSH